MLKRSLLLFAVCIATVSPGFSADKTLGVVDFKECLDRSKLGKKEQKYLEDLRTKITSSLSDKEKELTDTYNKLNDPEYMDGLSPTAEKELQGKFQSLSEEMNRLQYENSQMATQSQYKVLQSLDESIKSASAAVAKKQGFDVILNKDTSFYHSDSLDVTSAVIDEMDKSFESNPKSSDNS
jgi:outer membrane protein